MLISAKLYDFTITFPFVLYNGITHCSLKDLNNPEKKIGTVSKQGKLLFTVCCQNKQTCI